MIRREMTSKYPGRCKACGGGIAVGETITWVRNGDRRGRGSAYHLACNAPTDDAAPSASPAANDSAPSATHQAAPVAPSAPVSAPVSADPALDALARALLPRLEALGIATTQAAQSDDATTRVAHDVFVTRADGVRVSVTDAHPQFAALTVYATTGKRNAYVWGAPGAGKSHAAKALAEVLGIAFRYVSLSPQSMPSVLLGYCDAQGRYVSTGFRHCYQFGGVFCIDEVDNASANLLATLNSALANGTAEFPDGQVTRHPDCIVIATGNTPGFGPTLAFPERRPLDRAFRDRFKFLRWQYAPDHERSLARAIASEHEVADAWCDWVHAVRDYAASAYPALTCSPRAIYEGVELLAHADVADVAEATLFQGTESGVVAKILSACPLPKIIARKAA